MINVEDLYIRVIKLEEMIEVINSNLIKEHIRLLNAEHGKMISSLKKEFAKYNPELQDNVKKILLSNIPEKPMTIESYMTRISSFCKKNGYDYFNLAKFELTLNRLGFVKDGIICRSYVEPERLRYYLDVL